MATFSLPELYYQWEAAGVFEFFLPALLIFSITFAVLTSTNILGKNKGISFLVALSMSILAIRVPIVSQFFTTLLPGFGIGIAILVVVLIMTGLFLSKANFQLYSNIFTWGGLVVGLIIVIATMNYFDWFGSFWWQDNWTTILWVIIIGLVLSFFLIDAPTESEKKERRASYEGAFPIWMGRPDGK